jgi:hypothetical protein
MKIHTENPEAFHAHPHEMFNYVAAEECSGGE